MTRTSRYKLLASGLLVAFLPEFRLMAQAPAENRIEASCVTVSGDASRGEDVCIGFAFSDGATEIAAGLATASEYDFESRVWRLTDGVRLAFETTEIIAEDALLRFENGELVSGELNGSPVEMSDYIEERDVDVRGSAETISYDLEAGTLRLNGPSTLVVGDNEYMGSDWVYNFNDKKYGAVGVQFLLTPPEDSDEAQSPIEAP